MRVLCFIAPLRPTGPVVPCEHLQVRAEATGLDDWVLLIGFTGVLALPAGDDVDLPPPWLQCAQRATHAKQGLRETSWLLVQPRAREKYWGTSLNRPTPHANPGPGGIVLFDTCYLDLFRCHSSEVLYLVSS